MQKHQTLRKSLILLAIGFMSWLPTHAGDNPAATITPTRMTVTLQVLGGNKRTPEVTDGDVIVKQGNQRLQVTNWAAARGDRAGLDLFILVDDAAGTALGSQLEDLRTFINAQPSTTIVGYMWNGTVQIVQNFTADHSQAAKAVRLPIASSGAYGSPYLSVIDLMKRWPENGNRREVVMVTDGIDRFRGGPRYRGLGYISPDVDSASHIAQRTGTIIHTIFARGVGRLGYNFWAITNGQNGMAMLSEQTGGQSYYLGVQNSVSLKPYLDDLPKTLDNQYVLEFHATPGDKSELRYVTPSTEVAGVELGSADSVWVNAK